MDRRAFLYGTMATVGTGMMLVPARSETERARLAGLRGSFGGGDELLAAAGDDQSKVMQAALDRAGREGRPLFLPPGRYEVSNLVLPAGVHVIGVPGQSRLVYSGGGRLLDCADASNVGIDGVVIDGANRSLDDPEAGLLAFRDVRDLVIERSEIVGSSGSALVLTRTAGRITSNRISGAADIGLSAVESGGLTISDNTVTDCGEAGVALTRWDAGEDGSIVSGNRIERIARPTGAGGRTGTGIRLTRAGAVIVTGNRVTDCATSAIAASESANLQLVGNSCLRSGGAAIDLEAGNEGAVLSGNLVEEAGAGIRLSSGTAAARLTVCQGNVLRRLRGGDDEAGNDGVGIAVEADASVTGNVVEDAASVALMLGPGGRLRNVVASANVLRGGRVGIAVSVAETAGHAVLADNVIEGQSEGAIRGLRGGLLVTGDLARASAANFPHLTIENNRVG